MLNLGIASREDAAIHCLDLLLVKLPCWAIRPETPEIFFQ